MKKRRLPHVRYVWRQTSAADVLGYLQTLYLKGARACAWLVVPVYTTLPAYGYTKPPNRTVARFALEAAFLCPQKEFADEERAHAVRHAQAHQSCQSESEVVDRLL
ncbi:hypothetical protein Q1695_002567 [Nippostrongylus brasiliensis]|nr:hypothetical protein Q1695_002567 [Nippostrongylus brasiliensis]